VNTTILLCRHAHPANPNRVFYGHLPGFGLSELGKRQARGLGHFAAGLPVTHIYASPLERAQETATIAAAELPRPVPIETREDLVEAAFGRYIEGVRQAEVAWRRPLWFIHMVRPGALEFDESVAEMAARVERVLIEAKAAAAGEAAIVVSHADPVKAFWNHHLGRPDWRFHTLELAKGGFLELAYEDDRLVGVTPHRPIPFEAVPEADHA
jgi:broad specificity phosphatase PhoE